MPRGDKSAYSGKQKRQAEHIEEGYEARGVSDEEAERRAWATVNKMSGGGNRPLHCERPAPLRRAVPRGTQSTGRTRRDLEGNSSRYAAAGAVRGPLSASIWACFSSPRTTVRPPGSPSSS